MQNLRQSTPRWIANRSLTSSPSRTSFICSQCRALQQQQQSEQQPSRFRRRSFTTETASPSTSSPPPPPPPVGHARLTTRRLISLTGSGAPQFLQGLVTTSIPGSNPSRSPTETDPNKASTDWSYCGFLNATGRVLHDVFIYPVAAKDIQQDPAYMIEVDETRLPELLRHIKRYKLRSKIAFHAVDPEELAVWQFWNDHDASPVSTTPLGGATVLLDHRAPGMGYRVLASPRTPIEGNIVDETAYRVRRYLLGVPEGCAEIIPEHALPSESNMDVMGGVDFRKGCYVGQELTIRTRHRGVVRKRILPVMLYDGGGRGESSSIPPTTLEYDPSAATVTAGPELQGLTIGRVNRAGRSAGTFLSGVGNIGLALCRLQIMTDLAVPGETTATAATAPFDPAMEFLLRTDKDKGESSSEGSADGQQPKEGPRVKAFVPLWLRVRLDEEAAMLQARHHGS